MSVAIESQRGAFAAFERREGVHVPNRLMVPMSPAAGESAVTLVKPASLNGHVAVKIVSVVPENAKRDLPTVPALIVLLHEDTGFVRAIMDATYLTGLRTAAGSAVATDLFAKPHPKNLVVFGAGLQAELHILALLEVRSSLEKIVIFNRTRDRAMALAAKINQAFDSVQVCVADIADQKAKETHVKQAEILVTATNSCTPLFDGAWLSNGCHINSVGSFTPLMQEVDGETVRRSFVVVDTDDALSCGDISVPLAAGMINKDHIAGELGHFVVKRESTTDVLGGHELRDITWFKSVGTAVQDTAIALEVARAVEQLD